MVNSVEDPKRARRTGVEHYLYKLSLQKDYREICTSFDEYRRNGLTESHSPWFDDEEQDSIEEQRADDERTNYPRAPNPPSSIDAYGYQIYTCATTNPAVLLAITRIGQRNLPFINFQSAINHLPNLSPSTPLPTLQHGVPTEDIPYLARPETDILAAILFLPLFYHDGRHALGYLTIPPPDNTASDRRQIPARNAKQLLFTPCKLQDLEMYGLITYADGRGTQLRTEEAHRLDSYAHVQSVGVRGGRWVGTNTVEQWGEWREAFNIVARLWEEKLKVFGLVDLIS